MYSTLITVAELSRMIHDNALCVIDCRFDLGEPSAGLSAYRHGHIPGAVYADLEDDLSSAPNSDCGRHPLPTPEQMCETFARLGISSAHQVVVYDDAGGMIAARAWWMLHYLGHSAAAVLDGSWRAWEASGAAIEAGENSAEPAKFQGTARRSQLVIIDEVSKVENLIDARDPQRYRGEVEPLDPRPGHILGAKNHFFRNNLDSDGFFRTPFGLKQAFARTLGTLPGSESVHYCGSGVSACHNILAQMHAGLDEPRLYCGSWSEWCADPERPAATGDEVFND
jgi:thiosulfate/3-mercaptopyruvate sulfurtransferase